MTAFAIPLPLYVIGRQMGVPDEDMPQIKKWTDAWIQRMGLMQTPEERIWSAEQEIEAQNYFQEKYEELRQEPKDTLLSDLVNNQVKEWGRTLTDNELHSEMMADLFVGGSETTTNALSGGVLLLIQNPNIWEKVSSDTDRFLEPFVEEILRLESPVQCLLRETSEDIEIHGVTIPEGAIVSLRTAPPTAKQQVRESGGLRPRSQEPALASGLRAREPPLPRGAAGPSRAVLRVQGAVRAVRGDVVHRRRERLPLQPNYFLRALNHLNIGFKLKQA